MNRVRPSLAASLFGFFFPDLTALNKLKAAANTSTEHKAHNPMRKVEKLNRRKALKRRAFLRQKHLHKNSRRRRRQWAEEH
jgi:hypothetical protein